MMDYIFVLTVIGTVTGILALAVPYSPSIFQKFKQWGTKKTLNLISALGLMATGVPMGVLSGVGDAQMFQYTGLIIPFVVPTIHDLTPSQAAIFGNFANFFAFGLIVGGLAVMLGVLRFQKFRRFRDNNQGGAGIY